MHGERRKGTGQRSAEGPSGSSWPQQLISRKSMAGPRAPGVSTWAVWIFSCWRSRGTCEEGAHLRTIIWSTNMNFASMGVDGAREWAIRD